MTEYWQKVAHENANRFAKDKVDAMVEGFFKESGLIQLFREKGIFDKMDESPDLGPWKHSFGKWIALTYAMGYLDGIEKQKVTKLFVPGPQ